LRAGPLTTDSLSREIAELTGEDKLFFYDAAAPIIEKSTIDMNIGFLGDRYGKGEACYINLPMNKEEYEEFWKSLVEAEDEELHEFEKGEIFEGCMPIEVMAKRGIDTLRFGPLKPVGFTDFRTGRRPYAVVQLRQDNEAGNIFNMVGFQTNLKFGEQKRVFQMIPGLEKAEFSKYGVMHRNTFINSPDLLNETYQLRLNNSIYFAGQITGVEGYVESIASGLVVGINAVERYKEENTVEQKEIEKEGFSIRKTKQGKIIFPKETMIGALTKYIATPNDKFQPMNANFGILPELPEKIRDKKLRYSKVADRAIESLKKFIS